MGTGGLNSGPLVFIALSHLPLPKIVHLNHTLPIEFFWWKKKTKVKWITPVCGYETVISQILTWENLCLTAALSIQTLWPGAFRWAWEALLCAQLSIYIFDDTMLMTSVNLPYSQEGYFPGSKDISKMWCMGTSRGLYLSTWAQVVQIIFIIKASKT